MAFLMYRFKWNFFDLAPQRAGLRAIAYQLRKSEPEICGI
jgi:hypothetical protein